MFHLGIVFEFLMQMCVFLSEFPTNTTIYFRKAIILDASWNFTQIFFNQEKILSCRVLCNPTAAGVFYTYGRFASFLFSNGC